MFERSLTNTDWHAALSSTFKQPYMLQLESFLNQEQEAGKLIYPAVEQRFNALALTPLEQVKVVILGQDPYHGPGQAHGLSFSVPEGIKIPPSLRNIFKELQADIAIDRPSHGCLEQWAKQGVLLLNSVLTVEQGCANAHQGQGWERFTDAVIALVNQHRRGVVFMLWGAYAQKKGVMIDTFQHRILKAPHPSPLSAHRGFFGCAHFSAANQYLLEQGQTPIDWQIR